MLFDAYRRNGKCQWLYSIQTEQIYNNLQVRNTEIPGTPWLLVWKIVRLTIRISVSFWKSKENFSFLLIFPGGSDSKEFDCNAGDMGLIPGSGRFPGEGNGNPLQYSCLENPWTEESGRLQSMGRKELDMTEQLHFLFLWKS